MRRRTIVLPVLGLWCFALGGLLLHARIHPPNKEAFNWFAVGFALFNTVVLPWLFFFRRSAPWAYVINATSVIVGVVTMTWFSITHWTAPLTIGNLLLYSTLPDSLILLAKIPLAHQILIAWRNAERSNAS